MPQIMISHNPYTIVTDIIIDGKPSQYPKLREITEDSRLQMWVDDFIPSLMDCLDCRSVEITFAGTPADCEDVRDAVAKHSVQYSIALTLKAGGVPDEKLTAMKALFSEAKNGPIDELKAPDFLRAFEKAIDTEFEVSVQAPMKAGKSTFINAMLGHDLLPENIEACTATITYVTHDKTRAAFTGCPYGFNDKPWGKAGADQPVTAELLKEWNRDDVKEVRIVGRIPAIESKDIKLVIVDTPGPNNAQNEKHELAVHRFIKDSDNVMVLYLLNITQYQSDDNLNCLRHIAAEMARVGRQSSDRFLFVVTQTDAVDVQKRNIKDLIEGIRGYLAAQGISASRIIPVTAKYAKLARMKHVGEHLTDDEEEELSLKTRRFLKNPKLDYLQYADATADVTASVSRRVDLAKKRNDELSLMECYTGLAVVEATIQEFIDKYALPMKIRDAHIAMKSQFDNFNLFARLAKSAGENEEKRIALHEQMQKAEARLEDGKAALKFRKRAKSIVLDDQGLYVVKSVLYVKDAIDIYRPFSEELRKNGASLDPDVVRRLATPFENAIKQLFVRFCDTLEKDTTKAVMSQYAELKKDYVEYVQDLLGMADVDAPELNLVLPTMPDLDELRQSATSTVETGREPRLKKRPYFDRATLGLGRLIRWLLDDNEIVIHRSKRVDTAAYLRDVNQTITELFPQAQKDAYAATKQEVNSMVKGFLDEMTRLDGVIKATVDNLKTMSRSRKDAEAVNRKLAKKKDWLLSFESRLNDLIRI